MKQMSFSDGLTFFITLREYQPICAGIFFCFPKKQCFIFYKISNDSAPKIQSKARVSAK